MSQGPQKGPRSLQVVPWGLQEASQRPQKLSQGPKESPHEVSLTGVTHRRCKVTMLCLGVPPTPGSQDASPCVQGAPQGPWDVSPRGTPAWMEAVPEIPPRISRIPRRCGSQDPRASGMGPGVPTRCSRVPRGPLGWPEWTHIPPHIPSWTCVPRLSPTAPHLSSLSPHCALLSHLHPTIPMLPIPRLSPLLPSQTISPHPYAACSVPRCPTPTVTLSPSVSHHPTFSQSVSPHPHTVPPFVLTLSPSVSHCSLLCPPPTLTLSPFIPHCPHISQFPPFPSTILTLSHLSPTVPLHPTLSPSILTQSPQTPRCPPPLPAVPPLSLRRPICPPPPSRCPHHFPHLSQTFPTYPSLSPPPHASPLPHAVHPHPHTDPPILTLSPSLSPRTPNRPPISRSPPRFPPIPLRATPSPSPQLPPPPRFPPTFQPPTPHPPPHRRDPAAPRPDGVERGGGEEGAVGGGGWHSRRSRSCAAATAVRRRRRKRAAERGGRRPCMAGGGAPLTVRRAEQCRTAPTPRICPGAAPRAL